MNETHFKDSDGSDFVFQYNVPDDLIAPFSTMLDNTPGEACLMLQQIQVNTNIDDFLRYVLTFAGITEARKLATICCFVKIGTKPNSSFVFDVHDNNIVRDILIKQVEPIFSSSAYHYSFFDLYAYPSYIKPMHNSQYEGTYSHFVYHNFFAVSAENYYERLGLLNYLVGFADSFKQGVEMGFVPYQKSTVIDEKFPNFIDIIDFDENSASPLSVKNVRQSWSIFLKRKLNSVIECSTYYNSYEVHKVFMDWLLSNLDVFSKQYADKHFSPYTVCCNVNSQTSIYSADYVHSATLFLFNSVDRFLFDDICALDNCDDFLMNIENILHLKNHGEKYANVSAILLVELFDEFKLISDRMERH